MTGDDDTGEAPPLKATLARLASLQEQAEELGRRPRSPEPAAAPSGVSDEIAAARAAVDRLRAEAQQERAARDAAVRRLEERVEEMAGELARAGRRIAALEARLDDADAADAPAPATAAPVETGTPQDVDASLDELVARIERLKRTMRGETG